MYLYMAVTTDEYELPIAVESSVRGLAFKLKINPHKISESICKGLTGKYSKMKFLKVDITEEL